MTDQLITRDTDALVTLALTREGWQEADIRAAITDALACAVKWPTIMSDLVRLMRIEDAEPRDLVTAHQRRNANTTWTGQP